MNMKEMMTCESAVVLKRMIRQDIQKYRNFKMEHVKVQESSATPCYISKEIANDYSDFKAVLLDLIKLATEHFHSDEVEMRVMTVRPFSVHGSNTNSTTRQSPGNSDDERNNKSDGQAMKTTISCETAKPSKDILKPDIQTYRNLEMKKSNVPEGSTFPYCHNKEIETDYSNLNAELLDNKLLLMEHEETYDVEMRKNPGRRNVRYIEKFYEGRDIYANSRQVGVIRPFSIHENNTDY